MVDSGYRQRVGQAVDFLRKRLGNAPEFVIQLGTGLGDFAALVEEPVSIPYHDIPHFPVSTVTSHEGNLVYGRVGSARVAVLQGRFHYYEGYSTREVTFPIRVLAQLGAGAVIITNASGGLHAIHCPGTIMVIKDHINLLPENPLRGPDIASWGERFPDLSRAYDKELQEKALAAAASLGMTDICCGTYACVPGPSLETPAETRYLKIIGADAVGMSSVPEVIVAVHSGMKVLAFSVIANVNDPDDFKPILLDDIIQSAATAGPRLMQLISKLFQEIHHASAN
ncbi:MAG: purine-nucleoside phosphorylase [Deltaproteobacteria bacterium]|nr:MAG: purine-nucleoside phosphorylase [Deltaproteobacteria bacterium]